MTRRSGLLGVRARITLLAVVVVGVVLVLGALAFVRLTRSRIESSITAGATARAEGVVALVEAGALKDPLPGRDPEFLAQVVDNSGQVVAADRAIQGIPAFTGSAVAIGQQAEFTVDSLFEAAEDELEEIEDEGPYSVVAIGVDLSEGSGAVLVAASLEPSADARNAVVPVLSLGLPFLLGIVAATTWFLTGRALRPVERMRSEVIQISAADLDRRLPVPQARDEIHRLALTLNQMLERLEASATRQRRFVADASHELKSPLAALRTMVDVALEDPEPDDQLQALRDLGVEVDRMERLANDLLYLASYDEARPPERREEVDLDQVVGREGSSLRQRSPVAVDSSGLAPARIVGDPDRLAQLVRNLADNAARYARSTVWLETAVENGEAVLAVSDDGPGIPPADSERVFERFVRLDDSRTRDRGGAGLGLAVSRAIARSHGGDLRVVEPRYGGATLEARFPTDARTE
ncbi:MAG: ATP-binding protein [Acidimicrobiia bacterium]